MKLHEILIERVDLSRSTPIDFRGQQWIPVSGDMAGEGVQARVYKTGLGMVTKVAVLDEDLGMRDPAVKFLRIILQHQDNPFFPKIYHARVYRDKEGVLDPVLLVQMEKLMPLNNERIRDAVSGLFDQLGIGIKDLNPKMVQHFKQNYDPSTANYMQRATALKQKIMQAAFNDDPKAIARLGSRSKNPQFREAMKILAPAFASEGSDLHHGNWMVRLTGAGPQLVIVDPFAPSSSPNLG